MTRVLLVDDEAKVRAMLRAMLEGAGYEVAEAADGAQALRSFRGRRTDVVLCDLFMPERDGLEVIRELRRDCPEARVVAMSGGFRAKIDLLPAAGFLGAVGLLHKPFDRTALLAAVERGLDRTSVTAADDKQPAPLA